MSFGPWPTADQMLLMTQTWEQSSITESSTTGTIGMYGTDDVYYFYHTFQPANDDEWWNAQTLEKDFRVIYQMGNTLSDWTGVTKAFTSSDTYHSSTSVSEVTLDGISMTNSIKTGGDSTIETNARDNSTFLGKLTFDYDGGTPPSKCIVEIQRLIERTEQTEDDGSIERIETGRSLKGTYYQKDGTGISFTVELTGAMNSLAAAAGVALASTALLLAF